MLIFIVNIYNFFTALFFIGIAGFPFGIWLLLEIGFEVVLVIDFVMRFGLRKRDVWVKNWFLHSSTSMWFLMLSSIPVSTIIMFNGEDLDLSASWIAWLRILKFARFQQLRSHFKNINIIS
jgi:hypothetical protein